MAQDSQELLIQTIRRVDPRLVDRRRVLDQRSLGRRLSKIEEALRADPSSLLQFDDLGRCQLDAKAGKFAAGLFETPSIGELKQRALGGANSPSRLSLLIGTHPHFDIGTLQATAPAGTLFQVASQFNCLEAPGPGIVPVADYLYDSTQGPRASISAFPGSFLRHYAAPGKSGERFEQTNQGAQLNLLSEALPRTIAEVLGGYLRGSSVLKPGQLAAALEERFDAIRLGVLEGVEVVYGFDWGGPVTSPNPSIGQAFSSTIALGGYGASSSALVQACRPLLRAAYLGTLLAADQRGRPRVVLTMIGGGVFGNPRQLIWEAISWALNESDPLISAPLDVVVNLRTGLNGIKSDELMTQVKERGGSVLRAEEL